MLSRSCVGLLIMLTSLASAACRPAPSTAQTTQPAAATSGATPPRVTHPLDPLTEDEIRTVIATARTDARLAAASFPSITLHEPAKADVLAWQPGRTAPRHARLQAMTADSVFEVVADLPGRKLISVTEKKGVEPSITLTEIEAAKIVLSNAEFKAGLAKRGVTDLTKVFCAPFAAGYYANPAHEGKRIVKVGCFDTRRSTTNLFGWPIERLYALLDLRKREVLSVTDYGVVPIAPGDSNYTEAAVGVLRDPRKPTVLAQPRGANFTVDGNQVTWGKWRFHVRIDPRVGTVISLARWKDARGERSVLYQGYLSEMFVPYMDADTAGRRGPTSTRASSVRAPSRHHCSPASTVARLPASCLPCLPTTRATRSRRQMRSASSNAAPAIPSGVTAR